MVSLYFSMNRQIAQMLENTAHKHLRALEDKTMGMLELYIVACQGSGVSNENHLPGEQTRWTNPLVCQVDYRHEIMKISTNMWN